MSELVWSLMFSSRTCFPDTIYRNAQHAAVLEIERIAKGALTGDIIVDAMTDQIDVMRNGRRIATYMAM